MNDFEARHVEMTLWAFAQLSDAALAMRCLDAVHVDRGVPSGVALAGLFSNCEQRCGWREEQLLLDHLVRCTCDEVRGAALQVAAARAAEAGSIIEALVLCGQASANGIHDCVAGQPLHARGGAGVNRIAP